LLHKSAKSLVALALALALALSKVRTYAVSSIPLEPDQTLLIPGGYLVMFPWG
jgi:hypothetical protein